jgi:PhzF family phenazine biosynthesis protein
MRLKIFQVDAFTEKLFGGNSAAVCPLTEWLPDALMQSITAENNISETAFFVPEQDGYGLRWFTPTVEVELCGHATLATAHVLYNHLDSKAEELNFYTKSGKLSVKRNGDLLTLIFPATPYTKIETPAGLAQALGLTPAVVFASATKWMAVCTSQKEIQNCRPDFIELEKLNIPGIIITARGEACDFVSRFFTPRQGINEDPVTGSAHTLLIPYWAERLNKNTMSAQQLSQRGGRLQCKYGGRAVEISGSAVTYLTGEIEVG